MSSRSQLILSRVSTIWIGIAILIICFDIFLHRPISGGFSIDKLNLFLSDVRQDTDDFLSNCTTKHQQNINLKAPNQADLNSSKPAFYFFSGDSLVYWKNPFPLFQIQQLVNSDGVFQNEGIYYYYYSSKNLDGYQAFAVLALNQNSSLKLSDWILSNSNSKHNIEIDSNERQGLLSITQENILALKVLNRISFPWVDWVLGSFYLALLIYSLIYFYYLLFRYSIKWKDIVLFSLIGIGLKLSSSTLEFFIRFNRAEVFTNTYGINWWIPSIADLAILSVVLFLIILSISKKLSEWKDFFSNSKIQALSSLIGLNFLAILLIKLIQKVILKSQIPFNIEQVFHVDVHTVLSIGSLLLLVLGFFIFSHGLYRSQVFNSFEKNSKLWMVPVATVLTIPLMYWIGLDIPIWIYFVTLTSFFILLDLFIDATQPSITWLIWWMIIIGGIVAIVLYKYRGDSDKQNDLHFLQSLQQQVDNNQREDIASFQQNLHPRLLEKLTTTPYPFKLNESDLLNFLKQENPFYQTVALNHDINIKCYDRFGRSIIEQDLSTQLEMDKSESYAQKLDHGFYFDPFYKEYFLKYEITNSSHPGSPFQLYFSLKHDANYFPGIQNKPSNLELLITKNNQLVFADNLEIQKIASVLEEYVSDGDKTHFILNGYQYSHYEPENKVTLIGRRPIARLIKPISLFSYIFTLLGLIIVILSILNSRYPFLPEGINLNILNRTSLRNRIQLSVVMLIIVSFIIIGLVTVYYFKTLSNNFSRNELLEKTIAVNSDLNYTVDAEENEFFALQNIQRKISQLQFIHQSPIIFYNASSSLMYSSNQKSDSPLLHKIPFSIQQNLKKANYGIELTQFNDQRGNTTLQSFSPIYVKQNQLLGFISLKFSPDTESRIDVNDFMGALLNVYVFLFLIAGAIAIAVANSITLPIAELGEKLRRVKLGKRNEPLVWKSKDELGELIEEYNRMIEKLDESAMLLAKTERDLAWREMAKQVAHEIKNPLTPMKLSIQYLKKAVHGEESESGALINQVSNTLIEQIDNLSQIANEFSNFAKLPQARNEKIILNEVVETIHDLFRKREDMDFLLHEPIDDLYVFADRNQLIRILNNIVKNATQAIPEDRRGKIEINLYKEEDKAIIQITDNGSGIPKDMRDKVFSPYFTTKSSGTGLGLAIAANMIDSCNGKIYFSSEENIGTHFFIEIPLMRLENNFPKSNRVNLDDV